MRGEILWLCMMIRIYRTEYFVFRMIGEMVDTMGLRVLLLRLGKKDFIRIRIGIAPPEVDGKEIKAPHGDMVQGYVLGAIKEEEEKMVRSIASRVLGAIQTIVKDGYMKAMEGYNSSK